MQDLFSNLNKTIHLQIGMDSAFLNIQLLKKRGSTGDLHDSNLEGGVLLVASLNLLRPSRARPFVINGVETFMKAVEAHSMLDQVG